MTIAAFEGICPTCGHDHDAENAEFQRMLRSSEPATEAVLNDVIDRLGEEYAGEDFAGDTDAWNMTVGHCIEVVRAALKGKGASQGALNAASQGEHQSGLNAPAPAVAATDEQKG